MNHQRKCPTESALRDFCLGRLEPDMWDDVSSHVDDCAECQTTVVGMDDTHDSLVRELRTPTEDSSGQCDIRRLIELANAGRQSAESDRDQQTQIVSGSPGSDSKLPGADGVLGQYRLLALLGEGGMGSVYRAEHMRLKRPVAVKVLSGKRFSDPASTDRFQREIESLGQLQHPHIVNATDAGEADGIQYLVMEHVDGIDFSRLAQRIGPLRVPDACELIRQAALGLQHAHECGFIHRDIKPANLMLACDAAGTPVVKILDLGLARLCHENASDSDLTQTGQVMGTADYMPPEQSTGEIAVDIRSDLYSLGCTLYRLLAGQAPFSGPEFRTAFERMRAHVELAPPSVTTLREDVPAGLDAIIQRLLAKSPDDRFQTPLELAEALGQFTAGCDLAALLSGKVHGIATRRSYESAPDNSVQVPRQSAPAAMGTPLRLLLGLLVLSFLIGAGLWAGGMLPPGNAQSEATTPPPNSGGENGDSTGALNAPPEPDDMKSLFDGKTLEGWDGDSQLWSVKDGVIRGETTDVNKAAGNTFLICRTEMLKDFELRLSFRCSAGNDSGIQYRSKHITSGAANKWNVRGYQHEIRNADRLPSVTGFIFDEGRLTGGRDIICPVGERAEWTAEGRKTRERLIDAKGFKDLFRLDDWNDVIIRCEGTRIRHYLNGRLTVDFTDAADVAVLEGILALQLKAGQPMWVEFKDIRIRHFN